jgi:hypothetical protein
MLPTSGACLPGRKIMVQVNNLNTPVQVIHQVMQTLISLPVKLHHIMLMIDNFLVDPIWK